MSAGSLPFELACSARDHVTQNPEGGSLYSLGLSPVVMPPASMGGTEVSDLIEEEGEEEEEEEDMVAGHLNLSVIAAGAPSVVRGVNE